MASADPARRVEQINDRLKAAAIPVRVRLNGKVLGLRATLPLKPGRGVGRKQQDIRMGIPVSRDGFKLIEVEAHKLGELLLKESFSWDLYLTDVKKPEQMTVSELVQAFKAYYLQSHKIEESTWNDQWRRTFNRLPQDEPLCEASVLVAVLSTQPHSDTRKRTCSRLQQLAEFAGFQIDLKPYAGNYSYRSEKPRDIPNDELIKEWRDRIPNAGWQWVYGMMAAFGLRPHECFLCEFIDDLRLRVFNETKTGSRIVRPIPPEWVTEWDLTNVIRPKVTKAFGNRNKRQFQRYHIPFPAYNLRHAYAIRGSVTMGLPVSTMASMMGHSAAVHTREYHHWLSDATNDAVYRKIVLGEESAR
jgi:integrase